MQMLNRGQGEISNSPNPRDTVIQNTEMANGKSWHWRSWKQRSSFLCSMITIAECRRKSLEVKHYSVKCLVGFCLVCFHSCILSEMASVSDLGRSVYTLTLFSLSLDPMLWSVLHTDSAFCKLDFVPLFRFGHLVFGSCASTMSKTGLVVQSFPFLVAISTVFLQSPNGQTEHWL